MTSSTMSTEAPNGMLRDEEAASVPARRPHADMVEFLHSGRPPPRAAQLNEPGAASAMHSRSTGSEGLLTRIKQRYTASKPDPWLQMKFAVGIVLSLFFWSFYVVVGRICAPAIQQRSAAGFSRGTGIAVLIGYIVVWLMSMWTYMKMLLTGPGFARNHVPRSVRPPPSVPPSELSLFPPAPFHPPASGLSGQMHHSPKRDERLSETPIAQMSHGAAIEGDGPDPSELAPIKNFLHRTLSPSHVPPAPPRSSSATLTPDRPEDAKGGTSKAKSKVADWRDVQRPVPKVEIGPRWCRFCEINKPDRTHHCRHCGTCVMQFDHHCIWVGQCVGWGNHKFFMIFCFWGALFCFYMMITCIIYATRDTSVDGQVIGIIAASALFGLFTTMMFLTHLHLIMTGKSTVESFKGRDQQEQESTVLHREYGMWWHNQEKKKVQKKWKEEWGGSAVDDRWKWGSAMGLWRQEMGDSVVGWILPIGRPQGNGVEFHQNPRFGPNGEWLQKKDWPAGIV